MWMGWGLPIKARAKRSLLKLTGGETWLGPPCSTFSFSTSYSKLNFRNPLQWSTNIHESIILQTLAMSLAVDSSSSHSWPLYSFLWPWLWAFWFCLYLCPSSSLCFFPLTISLHRQLLPCLFCYIFNSFIQFDIFSLGPSPKYSNKMICAERVPHMPQFYAEAPIPTHAKTNSVFSPKPIFFILT